MGFLDNEGVGRLWGKVRALVSPVKDTANSALSMAQTASKTAQEAVTRVDTVSDVMANAWESMDIIAGIGLVWYLYTTGDPGRIEQVSANEYCENSVMEVSPGEKYRITIHNDASSGGSSYTSAPNIMVATAETGGYRIVESYVGSYQNQVVTIPESAEQLYLLLYSTGRNLGGISRIEKYMISEYAKTEADANKAIQNANAVAQEIIGKVEQIDQNTQRIAELKSDLGEVCEKVKGNNLLDISKCVANKYLDVNGTMSDYSTYVTDYIPVTSGMKLVGTYTLWGTQNLYPFNTIVFYNGDKILVSGSVRNINQCVIPSGVSYVRCTINPNLINYSGQIELTEDGTPTPYKAYEEPYAKLTDEIIKKSSVATKEYVDKKVDDFLLCTLPSKIYILEGRTIEIYYSQVLFNRDDFSIYFNGNISIVELGNRIRYTMPVGNAGYVGYTDLTVYKNNKVVYTKRMEVYRVKNPTNNVYVLPFGDSLTNHCVWESEAMNISDKLSFVGSRSRTITDADGNNRLVYDEGRAGFTTFDYTSGKSYTGGSDSGGDESVNRWYDGTKFSTSYYFSNHFPTEQNVPSSFNFFLGMNDLVGSKTIDEIIDNVKFMLDDIVSYSSTLKISVCSPQLRWGANYNERKRFMQFANALEELCKTYTNIVYVPLIICMDSDNNYNMKDAPINSRSTLTEKVASDITHPANNGYWQMADLIVGAILR